VHWKGKQNGASDGHGSLKQSFAVPHDNINSARELAHKYLVAVVGIVAAVDASLVVLH
jgi:hypothetical protein